MNNEKNLKFNKNNFFFFEKIMNIKPRLYADANLKKGPTYFEYENMDV